MFRLTCSVVLWGGRNTANKYHWRGWGVLAVSQPDWVCPRSRRAYFPSLHCLGFRLLCGERALDCVHFPGLSRSGSGSWVLHKGADSVGPAFCAIPQLEQLRRPGAVASTLSSGAVHLITSLVPAARVSGSARLWCAMCLFWGADLWLRPSQRMSTVQNPRKSLVRNWKPVCSLVGDALSGAKFAPFLLWLVPACPLCPVRDGLVCSRLALLWYSLSPLFCEQAGSALG